MRRTPAITTMLAVLMVFSACSRMPPEIVSTKVGKFVPDIDDSDGSALGLAVNFKLPGEGSVRFALPSVEREKTKDEWMAAVARFDGDFDRLVARVATVRDEIAPKVLTLQRKWFPRHQWDGMPDELMRHLKMTSVNYYGDGTFAVWFEGDELFDCLDLDVELNKEWVIDIVKFDG